MSFPPYLLHRPPSAGPSLSYSRSRSLTDGIGFLLKLQKIQLTATKGLRKRKQVLKANFPFLR